MNYLDTMKNIFKNKEKRVENLIILVVLLVILLVAANYIFGSKDNKNKNDKNSNNTSSTNNIDSSNITTNKNNDQMETKLSLILSQIQGISDVSVVLSYSQDAKQVPVFNTKEQEKQGESTTEKIVAYNEQSGNKTAIIESVEFAKVEGAIVVAKGADTVDIRSKIANAVATVTNIPVYKVQVFEKQG